MRVAGAAATADTVLARRAGRNTTCVCPECVCPECRDATHSIGLSKKLGKKSQELKAWLAKQGVNLVEVGGGSGRAACDLAAVWRRLGVGGIRCARRLGVGGIRCAHRYSSGV